MNLKDTYKHRGMRRALVKKLAEKGIQNERVLKAIGNVPRHVFFDDIFLEHAYQDKAFPIAEGQTISQPYTVAFQTGLLDLSPGDKVLEIGTGSGYQCSVLLEIGVEVVTIEYKKKLALKAREILHSMDYKPVFVVGDGSKGYEKHAPYKGIIVTAGAPNIPNVLIDQLALGGKLVIPVGDLQRQKMLKVTKKSKTETVREEFSNFSFVPLLGDKGWKE